MDIKDDAMTIQNQRLLGFFALLCIISMLLINYEVLLTITEEWGSSGAYSHGYLGFILVCYALWLKRTALSRLVFNPSLFAGFGLFISCSVLLFSNLASIQQLQQASLFLVLLFIMATLGGAKVVKELALPLLMLALILPIWNLLQLPLRDISTIVSWWGANLLGSEVIRNGYQLATPGGIFAVEPACSGLGFFLVAALLAVWVSFSNRLSWIASAQFLVIALSFAIIANWIRIITIVVVGDRSNMQHVIVQDHLSFGWYVFSACLVPLIFVARRYYSDNSNPLMSGDTGVGSTRAMPDNNNIVMSGNSIIAVPRHKPFQQYFTIAAVGLIVILFSFANYLLPSRYQIDYKLDSPLLIDYTRIISDKPMSPNWQPLFHGASNESFSYFSKDNINFQLYLANYIRQSQGLEMIYVDNHLFEQSRWRLDSQGKLAITGSVILPQIQLLKLTRNQQRHRLIGFWYVVNGQTTADKYMAKLLEINATIQGRPGATLVAIALDYNHAEHTQAQLELSQFAQAVIAKITIAKTTIAKTSIAKTPKSDNDIH